MVAYSFAPPFRAQVAALTKLQTVRGQRKRHARPGERVQLYTAMRTRHCRKLVDDDPICTRVRPIEIGFSQLLGDDLIASIAVDGAPLNRDEIEAFAVADGFAPRQFNLFGARTARQNMGFWWVQTHGYGRFEGVVIEWRPA